MMKTETITPLGKMMWEKQVFEGNGNWKAAELLHEKIEKHRTEIKERKPINNEETRSEFRLADCGH